MTQPKVSDTSLAEKRKRETNARGTEGVFRHRLLQASETPERAQPNTEQSCWEQC